MSIYIAIGVLCFIVGSFILEYKEDNDVPQYFFVLLFSILWPLTLFSVGFLAILFVWHTCIEYVVNKIKGR